MVWQLPCTRRFSAEFEALRCSSRGTCTVRRSYGLLQSEWSMMSLGMPCLIAPNTIDNRRRTRETNGPRTNVFAPDECHSKMQCHGRLFSPKGPLAVISPLFQRPHNPRQERQSKAGDHGGSKPNSNRLEHVQSSDDADKKTSRSMTSCHRERNITSQDQVVISEYLYEYEYSVRK